MMNEKTVELAIPVNERDHVIGLADAPVTVVNYGDYECPDCHHRHREVEKLVDERPFTRAAGGRSSRGGGRSR